MKKMTHSLVLGSALAATSLMSGMALADISANVGATSNYLWRGVTQSGDLSAISGGLDYSHESGIYAGTWTSSLSGGQYELDIYAGYGGEAGGFSYDVGLIQYMYPVDDTVELDFMEAQVSAGFGPATLYVAKTIGAEDSSLEKDGLYISLSAETELNKDFSISGTVGKYSGKDIKATFGDEYTHYKVAVSKGDISLAIEKNNIDNTTMVDKDPRVTISWSKEL